MPVAVHDAPTHDVAALEPLNTKRDVAEFLGGSVEYVNALMRSGQLGYYKRGKAKQASVRIGREHVAALLRSWEQ